MSLLELLVATAIFMMLAVLAMGATNYISQLWQNGERQAQQGRNSRSVLDTLGSELSQAMIPVVATPPDRPNLQFVLNPPGLPDTLRGSDAVFWQAPVAANGQMGEIAEIGYFVRWMENRPVLCRFYVEPSDSSNYLIYKQYRAEDWLLPVIDTVSPADRDSNYRGLFAEDVIGLWVSCFDSAGNYISKGETYDSRPPAAGKAHRLPALAEVAVVMLDAHTTTRITDETKSSIIEALPSGRGSNGRLTPEAYIQELPESIRAKARAHTTRVYFKNHQ